MVLPVASALRSQGHEVIAMALTAAWGPMHRAGFQTIGFRDYIQLDPAACELGRRMAKGLGEHPDVHPGETAAYLGLSYRDLVRQYGDDGASEVFADRGRQAFLPMTVMREALRDIQPDLLLATSSPRGERASVLAAKEMNLRSAVMVDLLPQSEMEWLGVAGYGSRVCVLSEGVRQRLLGVGRQEDVVVVTGNPAFDGLFSVDKQAHRAKWREKFGFKDGDRVILFASQPDPERRLGSEVGTELSLRGRELGFHVVVRPHPNEDFDGSLLPEGTPVSGRDDELVEALCGCDGCVVISSTVGLQATILGVPMVVYDTPVNANPAPYSRMGIGTTVLTVDEVFGALKNGVAGAEFESGPATERVVSVVESLLGGE